MLLNFEHVTKTYGDRTLLNDVTFYLTERDRVGIVGVNGCGKSTLLKIAAGVEQPDGGSAGTDPNVCVSYLAQQPEYEPENTVLEQIFAGISPAVREIAEYEAIEILTRLGIADTGKKMKELSGGQRKRVALASCLVQPADLYILDEPTNHLDAEMIDWLENYLNEFRGALLFVTHDRYFLERISNRVLEVAFGAIYFYEGSYSAYLDGKARREEMQAASERKRQSVLRRELQWVLQGPPARSTKSKERLERYAALKAQQPPEYQQDMTRISAIASRLGKKTVELSAVSRSFGAQPVIRGCDLLLLRDDRIGIVGNNGAGKSTLLNLISGRLQPDSGTVAVGETVRFGYFSQHGEELDTAMTAIEYVKQFGDRIDTPEGPVTASRLMEQFLFEGPLQHRPIGRLSGGEKRRLFLLGILASAPNILLLDEPTNDLDIPTLSILEEYLETFPGAIIAVSHDRYFLDRICKRTFAIEPDCTVAEYPGGYSDWRDKVKARETAFKEKIQKDKPVQERSAQKPAKLKFSFKEQREYDTIDDDIAALEQRLDEVRNEQAETGSDYVRLQELMTEQARLETELEEKMERWVYLNDLAERIAAQSGS